MLLLGVLSLGASLMFLAFPALAQGSGGFHLQGLSPETARPGDLLAYTIQYQNFGWPLLSEVFLVGQIPEYSSLDSLPPDCQLYANIVVCSVGPLAQGEGGEIEVILRVDEDAPPEAVISSEVMAVGREPDQNFMWLNSTQGYTEIVVPALSLAKESGASVVYAGEPVTYTYVLTNTGDVALTEVTIADNQKSPPQVCAPVPHLEPSEVITCTWTTTLAADTTNIATASGLDPWSDPVTATASAFVDTIQPPGPGGEGIITLQKTASAEMVYIDETVVYTYTVSNIGDDPVHNITLSDDQLGSIAGPFDLEAGASAVFSASASLTADTTNIATAEGQNLLGDPVTATASAFVGVVAPDVTLSLALNASAPRVYAGDTVTYTYTVNNLGSDTAYDVVLADDLLGMIGGPLDLSAGESAVYVLSQQMDEDTSRVATVTGQDRLGKLLEDTAEIFVDTIQRPGPGGEGILALSVTPSATSVEAGTVVTYTYVVTNHSQDLINDIVVIDDHFGFIALEGDVRAFDTYEGFSLDGGETLILTLVVPLYESTTNVAMASGQDLLQTMVSAEASAFVEARICNPPQGYSIFLPLVSRNSP